MRVVTSNLLKNLGYEYYCYEEEELAPETSPLQFSDVLPQLSESVRGSKLPNQNLYIHQERSYNSLKDGKNVILISGTGSGKTEAWFLFTAAEKAKTLVVYPTLALSNDQIERLRDYSTALGLKAVILDSVHRKELVNRLGRKGAIAELSTSDLVVTNPAFLMNDLKRVVTGRSFLIEFINKLKLLVLDEFDFYGPREIALLLSMIKLIRRFAQRDLRFAILTATLGNPEELAEYLTSINGKETEVVKGNPFRLKNTVYVVLGKNLKVLWESLKSYEEVLRRHVYGKEEPRIGTDVLEALTDYEKFKSEVYKVIEALRSIGVDAPYPGMDPVELLREYAKDEGVTLVFTRGIRSAEQTRRRLEEELEGLVASHHHLVSKSQREEIERLAREGQLKVLISPRTLSQGLDIGTVVRVVHLGLPDSVREYRQREGRKGRRKELGFTETVIIPQSSWDRELLQRGVEALRKWAELELEVALVNPDNKYSKLFEALYKMKHPSLRKHLEEDEYSLLESLGLVKAGQLTDRGKRAWNYLNFYEFGPPFGFKRVMRAGPTDKYLEDIGHCDLVEKFQPGCFDYGNDGIVTGFLKRGSVITGVVEEPIDESVLNHYDFLAHTLEEYFKTKFEWREPPSIISDYYKGRLASEVLCVVSPPTRGFGIKVKAPNRVHWIVTSSKPRPFVTEDNRTILVRERKSIPVIGPTGGVYRDYTYGLAVELEPDEDLTWSRIGLAVMKLVMRRAFNIPVDAIEYEVSNLGDKKLMLVHEPESAGLIEKMDWAKLRRAIGEYKPDELDEVLLMLIDEKAHLDFVSSPEGWKAALSYAGKMVDYILASQRVKITLEGAEFFIPRPSRAHKLASLEVISLEFGDALSIGGISIFDGNDQSSEVVVREVFQAPNLELSHLSDVINSGFKVVVWDLQSTLNDLSSLGLRSAQYMLMGLQSEGRVVNLRELVEERFGKPVSPEEVFNSFNPMEYRLKDLLSEYKRSKSILEERGLLNWPRFTKYLREKMKKILEERAKAIYLIYMALRSQ